MVDINRHRFFLVQILKDIYSDLELANYLGFKGGGSALVFFVEFRMDMPLSHYLQTCIEHLEGMSNKGLLQGMGELLDSKMKRFVQTKMRYELIKFLKLYKKYPIF